MSTNVVERTHEFGVVQTIGGTPRTVRRMVLSEGVFIGAMSAVLAIVLALPLSVAVNTMIGRMMFNVPLPLILAPQTVLLVQRRHDEAARAGTTRSNGRR